MRVFLRRFGMLAIGVFVFCGEVAMGQKLIAETKWLSPQEAKATFVLPEGFEIQLVASEPEIQKPLNLAFDRKGRLVVTSTVEYPYPVGDDEAGRDGVTVLEDIGADGKARKVTRFAQGLNIPIGITAIQEDGFAVFSVPNIYRLEDTDGDGKADQKTELYGSIGRQDTHGMTSAFRRWLDGWIYACHGFKNDSEMGPAGAEGNAANSGVVVMNSGNTYRFKGDGSKLEQWTWGQVNPFGMTFDAWGNLYTSDCHTKPVYQVLRGAYYPSFGKSHDGLGFGPTMIDHSHGSTGIAGIAYYGDDRFPKEYQGNVYIGNPITGRVHRDILEQRGSTLWANSQEDLVKSSDPWFRPVDVVMGPDGAIYIADFYNRIIGHYEVPLDHPGRDRTSGRIWRVVYTGKGAKKAKGGMVAGDVASMDVAELLAALGDKNIAVRTAATHELVDRPRSKKSLAKRLVNILERDTGDVNRKTHALWALHRMEGVADELLGKLAKHEAAMVRTHVAKLLGELGDWNDKQASLAYGMLSDEDAFARRAAADAMGRHAAAGNVEGLLTVWDQADDTDTHLIHTVRMALRDQLKAVGYESVMGSLKLNSQKQRQLADVSRGLWTVESARFVLGAIEAGVVARAELMSSFEHVIKHGDAATMKGAMNVARSYQGKGLGDQLAMLGAMDLATRSGKVATTELDTEALKVWAAKAVVSAFESGDLSTTLIGVELARTLEVKKAAGGLALLAESKEIGKRGGKWPSARREALRALMVLEADGGLARLDGVIGDTGETMGLRQRAVDLLATRFKSDTMDVLVKHLRVAPRSLAVTLSGALTGSDARTRALLDEIEAGRAAVDLLTDRTVEARMQRKTDPQIKNRFEKLIATAGDGAARMAELIDTKRVSYMKAGGDATKGKVVFDRACAACHELAGAGGRVGPGLDGIGGRGLERLLEDVLDPNRNVDEAFWLTIIETSDGRSLAGLVGEEVGGELMMTDMLGKAMHVKVGAIKERTVMRLSLMPPNMVDALVGEELNDLVAYLLGQREGGE